MRSIFKLFNASLPLVALSLLSLGVQGQTVNDMKAASSADRPRVLRVQGQTMRDIKGQAMHDTKGQTMRDVRVISARAGGVNFVSGDVRVKMAGQNDWQALTAKNTLATGDTVTTGASGQLEVLLNPGSYFRLAENSEFTLADDSLAKLRLSLTKGSGLVEATGFSELRVSILVDTPQTRVEIVRSGLYRINLLSAHSTDVAVQKGRALIGKTQPLILKGGHGARVSGTAAVEVAKLDKREKDAFDLWSRDRAKLLVKANGKLSTRTVNGELASMTMSDIYWPGTASGVWYFDQRLGHYVFIPGFYGWSSPYGFSYSHNFIGWGRICNSCGGWNGNYQDVWSNTNNNGGFNNGGGGGGINKSTSTRDFPSQTTKQAPEYRPAPTPVKSVDKTNRDQ